jgi:four helix bundle protein
MRENTLKIKSFAFAIRIFKLSQFLQNDKREFIISKQVARSGTSVGAMIREAEHSESKPDFIHKLAIAQKEINETIYWLEVLHAVEFLSHEQFNSLNRDAVELIKLLTTALKTAKLNLKLINH